MLPSKIKKSTIPLLRAVKGFGITLDVKLRELLSPYFNTVPCVNLLQGKLKNVTITNTHVGISFPIQHYETIYDYEMSIGETKDWNDIGFLLYTKTGAIFIFSRLYVKIIFKATLPVLYFADKKKNYDWFMMLIFQKLRKMLNKNVATLIFKFLGEHSSY